MWIKAIIEVDVTEDLKNQHGFEGSDEEYVKQAFISMVYDDFNMVEIIDITPVD